ncbi:hypothetical protein KIW84_064858 [Lathyrus oleraceus]|uniref:Uncharacterized protein n=1 Tax=Pisum sativum TaxID=3888 RepID=A0A9D5A8T5_PEA|nr:hypothetical protein KIW84_064858 [Pisum sativum]
MIVAAASSHNPTLVGVLTRLKRCAFSRSRKIQIIDAQALTTLQRQRFVIYCREIDGIASVTTGTGLAVPENHCCYSFCMFGNEAGLGMQLLELVLLVTTQRKKNIT